MTAVLTERFRRALRLALALHAGQTRKAKDVPYAGHLLGVAALVLEDGGDEEEAIAALLHDAAEDCGGRPVLERIRSEFGDRVAAIVDACSDTLEEPKPPWFERKRTYLLHLADGPGDALRVSLADKLYNVRAILLDWRDEGDAVWERFSASAEQVLWYYRSLAGVFARERPGALARELAETVGRIEAEAGVPRWTPEGEQGEVAE